MTIRVFRNSPNLESIGQPSSPGLPIIQWMRIERNTKILMMFGSPPPNELIWLPRCEVFTNFLPPVIRAMAMYLSCIMCWIILAMVWTISDARMRTIALRKQMQRTTIAREGVKNSIASCDMRYANACNPSIRNVSCRKMCCCSQTLHWIQIFDTLMQ